MSSLHLSTDSEYAKTPRVKASNKPSTWDIPTHHRHLAVTNGNVPSPDSITYAFDPNDSFSSVIESIIELAKRKKEWCRFTLQDISRSEMDDWVLYRLVVNGYLHQRDQCGVTSYAVSGGFVRKLVFGK